MLEQKIYSGSHEKKKGKRKQKFSGSPAWKKYIRVHMKKKKGKRKHNFS